MFKKIATTGMVCMALIGMGCTENASTGIPYSAAELTIDTSLNVTAVKVGTSVPVTCTVTHVTLGVVSVPTTVATNPVEGIRSVGGTVTPDLPGLYNVACIVTELPSVVDGTPETLAATTSGAAKLETVVDPAVTTPGVPSTVSCPLQIGRRTCRC